MSANGASASRGSGVGFLGLLTLVFITLKLIGRITWSWWWVLAPLWIPSSLTLAVLTVLAAAYLGSGRR